MGAAHNHAHSKRDSASKSSLKQSADLVSSSTPVSLDEFFGSEMVSPTEDADGADTRQLVGPGNASAPPRATTSFDDLPRRPPHRLLQVSFAGLGVNAGRVQALVAQERGHLVQRCAGVHQVLGKGVA